MRKTKLGSTLDGKKINDKIHPIKILDHPYAIPNNILKINKIYLFILLFFLPIYNVAGPAKTSNIKVINNINTIKPKTKPITNAYCFFQKTRYVPNIRIANNGYSIKNGAESIYPVVNCSARKVNPKPEKS